MFLLKQSIESERNFVHFKFGEHGRLQEEMQYLSLFIITLSFNIHSSFSQLRACYFAHTVSIEKVLKGKVSLITSHYERVHFEFVIIFLLRLTNEINLK